MDWINIREKWPDDENEILVCTISKKGVRNVDKGYAVWRQNCSQRNGASNTLVPLPVCRRTGRAVT